MLNERWHNEITFCCYYHDSAWLWWYDLEACTLNNVYHVVLSFISSCSALSHDHSLYAQVERPSLSLPRLTVYIFCLFVLLPSYSCAYVIKETDYHQMVISLSVHCHFNCTILLGLSNDSDILAKHFFLILSETFLDEESKKQKSSKVTETETVKIPDRSIWLIRQNEKGSDINILGLLNVMSHNMSVIKCPDILITLFWFCSGCCATPTSTIPKIQLLCYD